MGWILLVTTRRRLKNTRCYHSNCYRSEPIIGSLSHSGAGTAPERPLPKDAGRAPTALGAREGRGYTRRVAIQGFRHKGLELFFTAGKSSKIQAQHAPRLRLILGRLHVAKEPRDMNLPGLRLHPLKGDRQGTWAVAVSGNWRVTFEFVGQDVDQVGYEDYH